MNEHLVDRLVGLPRFAKRAIVLAVDLFLCFASVQVAFFLRLDHWQPVEGRPLYATIAAIAIALPLFITHGLYRAIFRYTGVSAMLAIARASLMFAIPYVAIFTLVGVPGVPRTIGIIEPAILFLFVAGSRGFVNFWLGANYRRRFFDEHRPRVVIYGIGDAGRQLASALGTQGELRLIGFADDDDDLHGSTLSGLPIYSMSEIEEMAEAKLVDEVLLAIPSESRIRRVEIVERLSKSGLKVRMLPTMIDIVRGKVSIADLKNVDIEDLLSRKAVPPQRELLELAILDRVVMVTGAGGSIGSELCRQIIEHAPTHLILIDSSEYNLYAILAELEMKKRAGGLDVKLVSLLGSVRDQSRMEDIFATFRPTTIYHAAAYKHVPLVESNPYEGLANNVLGTVNLVDLANRFDVEYFILISSDKAVRPTNIMGATKRFAELVVQAHVERHPGRRFSMVRFGNVLGSSGSVVPLFRRQIAAGGPVTVTDLEMTRFFMTIPEAAQLVIQAGAMAKGGEVFVLDMGAAVKIIDLAHNMIRLSGLTVRDADRPDGDIAVEVVGMRPGEKLYEELLIGDNPEASSHPRIMKAHESQLSWDEMQLHINQLSDALTDHDVVRAIDILCAVVPEYAPDRAMAAE